MIGIPTPMVTNNDCLKVSSLPLARLISGAASKKPKIKPPVGLKSLAIPEAPPEKTGNPNNPITRYNETVRSACLGVKISAMTLMTMVCEVTITGEKGSGKDK